jgi:hypothetical protein
MRRHLFPLFVALVGFAVGYVVARKPEKPERPALPVNWQGEVGVRRGIEPAQRLRPRSVHVDGQRAYLSPDASDDAAGPVTVLTLDGGRVVVACVDVVEK